MLARQLQVYMEYHDFSTDSLERLGGLMEHIEGVINVTLAALGTSI